MNTEVAIVGGSVAGAMSAIHLRDAGIDCVIVERERMPRYHIGESLTGEAGARLRDVGFASAMSEARFPVKLGVRVFGPHAKGCFWVPVMCRTPQGGLEEATTWQVRREDFDKMLLEEAERRGARVLWADAERPIVTAEGIRGLHVRTANGVEPLDARWVLDASGMKTFLSSTGATGAKSRDAYDNQIAIYARFRGAVRDEGEHAGDTLIFYKRRHHWGWFIPLDDTVDSIGVVVPVEDFRERRESPEAFLLRELADGTDEMRRRLGSIELVDEVRTSSNYSYRIERYAGDGFFCVGDAHRFIDPVFSFGVHLALHEAERAACATARALDASPEERRAIAAEYERASTRGMDRVQALIDAFWNNPLGFAYCVHSKYTGDMFDLFAGRLYDEEDSPGLRALQKINATANAA